MTTPPPRLQSLRVVILLVAVAVNAAWAVAVWLLPYAPLGWGEVAGGLPMLAIGGVALGSLLVYAILTPLVTKTVEALQTHADEVQQDCRKGDAARLIIEETSKDGIITFDEKGLVQSLNPAARRMFGFRSGEGVGLPLANLIHLPASSRRTADDAPPGVQPGGEAKARVSSLSQAVEGQRKDGSRFPLELAVSRLRVAGPGPFLVVVHDLTGRRQIEVALRQSEQRHRLVGEHAFDMITRRTPQGQLVEVSPSCRSLLGYEPEELLGHSLAEFTHTQDLKDTHRKRSAVMIRSDVYLRTYRLRRKDGAYCWVETTCRNIRDAKTGEVEELLCVTRDISDRKRVEERQASQNHILERIAQGEPVTEILTLLCRTVEEHGEGLRCAIHLLDADRTRLRHGAAPSFPEDFNQAFDGLASTATAPTCGAAAYLGKMIVATDLATDPHWAEHQALAARYHLRSCAAKPILSRQSTVLGTVTVYAQQARSLSSPEFQLLEDACTLAALVLERQQTEATLRAHTESTQQLFENHPLPGWIIDAATGRLRAVNEAALREFGYTRQEFLGLETGGLPSPDGVPAVDAAILAATGSVYLGQHRQQLKSGSFRDMEVSAHELLFEGRRAKLVLVKGITQPQALATDLRQGADAGRVLRASAAEVPPPQRTTTDAERTVERLIRQQAALLALTRTETLQDVDLRSVLATMTELAANTLEVDRVGVWQYDADGPRLRCLDSYERKSRRHSTGYALAGAEHPAFFQELVSTDVIAADDAWNDPRTQPLAAGYLTRFGIQGLMAVSFHAGEGLGGIISCEATAAGRHWTSDEQMFGLAVAQLVAFFLDRWALRHGGVLAETLTP